MKDLKKKQKIFVLVLSGFVLIFSIGLFVYKQATKTKLDKRLSQNKPITIFLSSVGSDDKISLSVFAILLPKEKKCGLYFINPLSSFDDKNDIVESRGSSKIHSLSKEFTHFSNLPVHYFLQVKEKDLEDFVDIMGGISFYFDDKPIPSTLFLWEKGEENLSGEAVSEYLKLKDQSPLHYVDRMNKQLSMMLTVYDRLSKSKDLPKEWIKSFFLRVKTDLSPLELFSLYDFFVSSHIIFSTSELPGELMTDKKTKEPFLFVKEDTAKISFTNFEKNMRSDYFLDGEKARTEVLNATDVPGLARRVKSILNDKRLKVLSVENAWITNQKKTIVIDRSGNTEYSYKIAETLNSKKVVHLIRKELGLDTTVIVGEDFEIKP
ncbi:MAG: LytR C-terminal domain-containing protein [Leptospiraceae bacterium]|nr:LCP family protein [Leptospiraceae bacterium]MCK6379745.1 LytR C-terminal domain-containing protein [Leptospiraceae bacterium]NUM40423.1 LCP family protein [Leptospiraceae bacterium]